MDRSTWETTTDVRAMISEVVGAKLDDNRASRLYACGCGRLAWDHLADDLGRPSVEVSERFADGLAGWSDLRAVFRRFGHSNRGPSSRRALHQFAVDVLMLFDYSLASAQVAADHAGAIGPGWARGDLEYVQAGLIRDLFGYPRQPEPFDPRWRTAEAVDLARGIHDERAFDRMPYLGDALEEAGCPSGEILDHCRHGEGHARGCWVVDAVLGRRQVAR